MKKKKKETGEEYRQETTEAVKQERKEGWKRHEMLLGPIQALTNWSRGKGKYMESKNGWTKC